MARQVPQGIVGYNALQTIWNAMKVYVEGHGGKIDTIKLNNTPLTIIDKAVNITNIPKTALASAVQTSLGKADTALQSHQDISGKENTSNKVTSWSTTTTDAHYPSEKLVKTALDGKANSSHTQAASTITGLASVATSGSYNDLSNKPTIPSEVTESTVSEWGFTKNTGTVTSVAVKLNGTVKGTVTTSGTIDLGTIESAKPTAFSWTPGTTNGPTGTLTGTGMSPVNFSAIPSASQNNAGVVTTGDQNLSGVKTIYGSNSGLAFNRSGVTNKLGFVMKSNGNLALEIL